MIIDSQVHVWPPDRPDRRLGDGAGDRKPYGYEALVADMDRAGVDRAILVPPSFDHDRNDYALEAVRMYPDRFAVMGRVPLRAGGNDFLERWRAQPGMLGVRLTFHRDADRPGSPTAPPSGSGRKPSAMTFRSWCTRRNGSRRSARSRRAIPGSGSSSITWDLRAPPWTTRPPPRSSA